MAEALGVVASGMTVAGLFKVCIEAFELIQSTRRAAVDFNKLLLRLRIERCRLYTWGEAMGLTKAPTSEELRAVEAPQLETVVKETLGMILCLFQDSEQIRVRYGGEKQSTPVTCLSSPTTRKRKRASDPMKQLAESFSNFQFYDGEPPSTQSLLHKTRWIIRDKAKFESLISDVKSFIDSLQSLTKTIFTASRQRGMLRFNLQQIDDMETLEILSEICEDDYPDLADAASVKMDVLTVGTSRRREIEQWVEDSHEARVSRQQELRYQPVRAIEEQQTVTEQRSTNSTHEGSQMNQQNLDQIVLEYLNKKGYTETGAVLQAESNMSNTFLDL